MSEEWMQGPPSPPEPASVTVYGVVQTRPDVKVVAVYSNEKRAKRHAKTANELAEIEGKDVFYVVSGNEIIEGEK